MMAPTGAQHNQFYPPSQGGTLQPLLPQGKTFSVFWQTLLSFFTLCQLFCNSQIPRIMSLLSTFQAVNSLTFCFLTSTLSTPVSKAPFRAQQWAGRPPPSCRRCSSTTVWSTSTRQGSSPELPTHRRRRHPKLQRLRILASNLSGTPWTQQTFLSIKCVTLTTEDDESLPLWKWTSNLMKRRAWLTFLTLIAMNWDETLTNTLVD